LNYWGIYKGCVSGNRTTTSSLWDWWASKALDRNFFYHLTYTTYFTDQAFSHFFLTLSQKSWKASQKDSNTVYKSTRVVKRPQIILYSNTFQTLPLKGMCPACKHLIV